jgi:hypothetical protein
MRTIITSTLIGIFSVVAGVVSAQDILGTVPTGVVYPAYTVPYYSSTEAEGFLRGLGDLARGAGEFNYLTSRAMINSEEARSRYLDNRMKTTQTYFDMRRYNREARAYENGPRPTSQDFARWAKDAAPDRLSSFEYEPALGRVFWPSILQSPVFSAERNAIDNLMALRTTRDSGLGSDNNHQIQQLVDQMAWRLKQNISTLSPGEYMAAKNFLTSLQHESQIPPRAEGLVIK